MFDFTSGLGLANSDLMRLNECFQPLERRYDKGEIITDFSSDYDTIGIIRRGTAYLVCVASDDKRRITEYYSERDFFFMGRSIESDEIYMYIIAKTKCVIDFIGRRKLVRSCGKQCRGHFALTERALENVREKTMLHINVLGQQTTRGKLRLFFSYMREKAGTDSFTLPMPCSDLADYLAVDRSAMMRELRLMREEGIIAAERRSITYYSTAP